MKQEEMLDYNKRCAEFLGYKKHKNLNPPYYTSEKGGWWERELQFHSDWNWIMEVVEAIKEKTKFKTVEECSVNEWYITIGVTKCIITTPKEAVVQAINQFLIWYNENN